MSIGMLSVGITGIQAAQMGLEATQHNIANVNTPGYSRQYIQQSAGIPRLTGSGYFGSGTTVDTVRRAYDKVLTAQTFVAQSASSSSATYLANITQVDNLLGDPNSGLAPAMQDFFTGVQQVAANPSLISARQSMLSSAQSVVTRFNSMSGRLSQLYDGVNSQVASEVQAINLYAQQIADLNGQITRAEAATNQSPNDLLDTRDQLVTELNKHVRVQAVQDSLGNFNVFAGNGQQLVVGSVVNSMVAMTSSTDPERVVVGLKGQSGTVRELAENEVDGGALGGLMSFRSNSLDSATNSLGQIAASLALTFNAQNGLGQDLEGLNATSATTGFQANFFSISAPRVLPASPGATQITASFLPPSMAVTNAAGDKYALTVDAGSASLRRLSDGQVWTAANMAALTPMVSAEGVDLNPQNSNFYTNLTGSDYNLLADATGVTLTRKTDGKIWTAANVTALNGMIGSEGISLNGTPDVGVNYLIEPTREVSRNIALNTMVANDPKRIAAAAPTVSTLGNANTGTMQVAQGSVSTGYALANLSNAVFTYSKATDQFSFPSTGAAFVVATYADGSTVDVSAGTVARMNGAPASALAKITYDGITVSISGLPANGDTFSLGANKNGISDSRNAVRLGNLQTQSTMDGGKATYQGTYASLVSQVGSTSSLVTTNGQAQDTLLKQNQAARSAISGVNLDEEAANLMRYQQAYQAAAKSIDVASKLFDTLLAIKS